jgi:hypothetical protein
MKTIKLLAIATLAIIGCGDNKAEPDARVRDSSTPDSGFPAAPTLGAQIDRMGRAAVNTALIRGFDPAGDATKQAYNEMPTKTEWFAPANVGEIMKNLAFIDVLDSGICGNARCETGETNVTCSADCGATTVPSGNGCGNQALYNGQAMGGGTPMATSYQALATVLADDELYLDTSKMTCALYLAVEFSVVTQSPNSTCGGRAPQYDVIDFSYSMLAMGIAGFVLPAFTPKVPDGVSAHADVSPTDFPFLGTPH